MNPTIRHEFMSKLARRTSGYWFSTERDWRDLWWYCGLLAKRYQRMYYTSK